MTDKSEEQGQVPAYPNREWKGMSTRQYAAIHSKVPNSGDEWLDDMILEAKRDELMMRCPEQTHEARVAVLKGWDDVGCPEGYGFSHACADAYLRRSWADAMLSARKS